MRTMRFECHSCHAKYRISDEKVRGRIVRFPCRKCEHKILIDGRQEDADVTVPAGSAYRVEDVTRRTADPTMPFAHDAPTSRARRPSAPVRRRPPSVPPRRPSAVSRRMSSSPGVASSALIGQHPGLAPAVPAAPSGPPLAAVGEVPAWHVSINDVPVGPIRLGEMAQKIDAGAVSEYSLVWREGFREWRPLATVPELMALLHERRHSGPPPRTSFSSMPAFVDAKTAVAGSARPAASPPNAAEPELSEVPEDFVPLADSLQPEVERAGGLGAMSQPPAPIGPAGVFESSPQLGSFSGLAIGADEDVSIPSVPPPAAAATAAPDRRFSIGVLALILAVIVFAGVSAVLVFDRFGEAMLSELLAKRDAAVVVSPAPMPADAPPKADEPEAAAEEAASDTTDEVDVSEGAPVEEAPTASEGEATSTAAENADTSKSKKAEATQPELAIAPLNPADDGPKMVPATRPRPKARRKSRSQPVESAAEESSLSADEQRILDDFGSSAGAAPAKIDVEESGSSQSGKPPLDGDGVRATVTTNKPRLQRCYERAIRGQQSPPPVRLDVTVTVAASGRVKEVSADGAGPGGLAECIEASVRRWRFPASAEGGPAKFPIVFSAN